MRVRSWVRSVASIEEVIAWCARRIATMAVNWSAAGWPWAIHCSRDHSTGSCRSVMAVSLCHHDVLFTGHRSKLALEPYYLVMEKSTYEDVRQEPQ